MPCTVLLLTTTDQRKTAVPGFTEANTQRSLSRIIHRLFSSVLSPFHSWEKRQIKYKSQDKSYAGSFIETFNSFCTTTPFKRKYEQERYMPEHNTSFLKKWRAFIVRK